MENKIHKWLRLYMVVGIIMIIIIGYNIGKVKQKEILYEQCIEHLELAKLGFENYKEETFITHFIYGVEEFNAFTTLYIELNNEDYALSVCNINDLLFNIIVEDKIEVININKIIDSLNELYVDIYDKEIIDDILEEIEKL